MSRPVTNMAGPGNPGILPAGGILRLDLLHSIRGLQMRILCNT